MSIEKCHLGRNLILAVFGAGATIVMSNAVGEVDPILRFYCEKARAACADRSPYEKAVSYSFTTTTYLKKLGSRGKNTSVDSTVSDLYFSAGSLDSQRTVSTTSGGGSPIDFSYPKVFESDYRFNFFPNDTGGKYLAIGFDTDSANDLRPVGLAIIDRAEYYLHRLYLFYPNHKQYKRFSRTFHFIERDGYIFPDSICEIAAKAGIFSTDYYRRETVIRNIRVRY